jgi:hypothetical protein
MIKRRFRWSWAYLSALSILLLSGRYTERPPQEIAQNFWNAIKVQDMKTARKYTTKETSSFIDGSTVPFRDAVVTFGKIIIDGDTTTVDTILKVHKNDKETTIPFQTVLKQENGEWRVDYRETEKSIMESGSFSDIIRDLQKLGKKVSDRMDETLDELRQKIPEYESKLKELGEATSERIKEAWERQLSEIRKGIEELGKILDETLKKEEDDSRQEKP